MTTRNVGILSCLVAISLWQNSLVTCEEVAEEKDDTQEKRYINQLGGLSGLGGVGGSSGLGIGGYTSFDDESRCGAYNNLGLHYANRGQNIPIRSYVAGGDLGLDIDESQFDPGYMQFNLCPVVNYADPTSQGCFNSHPLYLQDGNDRFFVQRAPMAARVNLRIPQNLDCNSCVLQYRYHRNGLNGQYPVNDYYGCSGLRIHPRGYQGPLTGPSAGGIIVNGPANFGNIYGPGSTHNGNSNAQSSSGVGSGIGGFGVGGVGGLAGVGLGGGLGAGCLNQYGCGGRLLQGSNPVVRTSVSSSSVVSHKTESVSTSNNRLGFGGNGGLLPGRGFGRPSAATIQVHGPANFGNIHGPGSTHNGNSNAFSPGVNGRVGGGGYIPQIVPYIQRPGCGQGFPRLCPREDEIAAENQVEAQ